ncbi:uncharacterized protein P884DRAFT_332200 [Thermothelomyces heterothallicus CBS 202.75]|uniref:uncharacterized protein n=1 Tax=Thermothelomyces heterothallicus CBS 202.75 TaxID=1149848 RepID=UPI003744960D
MRTAQHPQAKFDPIPPDLDLHALVERTPNFHWVLRVSAAQIRNIGPQEFERLVFLHVVHGGKPLVIEKWNDRLPRSLFSAEWLERTYNKKPENVRDLTGQTDIPMTLGHYLRSMKILTNQWTPTNFRDERRQRLYLKDMDCPPEWQQYLQRIIPPNLFYMNESIDERAGKARGDSDMDIFQEGRSIAPAGDLMSSLPEEMRAQNLMCYVGHEGTYTPAHREMCASLGQNIMVDASGDENGEKPGSSIWFMTETKDREVVREYFLSMLGHDIEIEKHFAQINAWKKATFPVYIVEQKVGDFILVPPLAPHQVWNRGTRTIKVAWNRTTVETLQLALSEALPKARLVCRDEQYKNKAIIFYTLEKYYKEMVEMEKTADIGLLGFGQDLIKNSTRMKQMAADFKALFQLYTRILIDEMFATREKEVEYIEYDSNITCSYCRANIFNRFLTCKHCVRQLVNGDEDTYDICMECYAMGRSCFCVSNLSWCEQWRWSYLVDRYETWRALIIKNDGYINLESSPLPLELARKRSGKKSVAQICQEQLRMRPWKDITQVKEPSEREESDVEVDDNGRPVKKRRKRKAKKGDVYRCHVCQHKDYTYKLAFCSNEGCTDAYCYGVLYRAFDLMPQDVMQNEHWQCPKCLKICNCAACRRAGNGVPYIPKTTLLGHDTRRIADDRSVETLVDFRVHNLMWLKSVGDESRSLSSKRMQRLQQAAEAEKAKQAELANQIPALPDGALAETLDAAMQQPVANGFSHQDGTQASGPTPVGDYIAAPGAPDGHHQQNGDHGVPPAEVADMSMVVAEDQSSYPDPSVLGRERMLGMGYYEQDDSPDKILFDPYQAPSADSMLLVDDQPEMSEYFRKQIRIAKRRARQEGDDDPDFQVPRSHHRKRPKLGPEPQRDEQEIALSNMDPALFDGDRTVNDVPIEDQEARPVQSEAPAEAPQQTRAESVEAAEETAEVQKPRAYSPNRPALRHARPKIGYKDDENGEEEFNEIVVPRSPRALEGIASYRPEDANKDPLDLASAAIFTMTSGATSAAQDSGLAGPPKKRGRPRKSDVSGAQSNAPPVPEPEKPARRRGRPPRARPSLDAEPEAEDDADLDAQLAQQLDALDETGEVIIRTETTPPNEPVASTGPRKRGRPRRNPPPEAPAKKSAITIELPSQSLVSMADKMRPKGKKFRIGRRENLESATPLTSPKHDTRGSSTHEAQPQPAAEERAKPGKEQATRSGRDRENGEQDEDFDPNAEEEEVVSDEAGSPSPSPTSSATARVQPEMLPESDGAFAPSKPDTPPPASSMAAREAPRSTSPPQGSVAGSEGENEPEPGVKPEPSPPPSQPRGPSGPTIVRLGDLDEEEEDSSYGEGGSPSPSGSTSGSDEEEGGVTGAQEPKEG